VSSWSARCRRTPAGRPRDEGGFDLSRFQIDWDRQQVTCPNGKTSRNWREPTAARASRSCRRPLGRRTACPVRIEFAAPAHQSWLALSPSGPAPQYQTQQQLRAEQATNAWRERYARRAGIEGTIAQAARRSNVHQARYRGLAKTHLQHVLTALALNLVRLDAWLTDIPPGGSRVSRLTRLQPMLSPV
jgi:Transposase DDE domain